MQHRCCLTYCTMLAASSAEPRHEPAQLADSYIHLQVKLTSDPHLRQPPANLLNFGVHCNQLLPDLLHHAGSQQW